MIHVKFNKRPFESHLTNPVDDLFRDLPFLFKAEIKNSVPLNINETSKGYSIDVIAPGFEKSDFKINLDGQLLTISAEMKPDAEKTQNNKEIRKEYDFHSFKRSFTIDNKIDSGNIEAGYINGVLTIFLPRNESNNRTVKEIQIK